MQNFSIKDPSVWVSFVPETFLSYPVVNKSGRSVKFDVISTGQVDIYLSHSHDFSDGDGLLIASGSGLFKVEVFVAHDAYFRFDYSSSDAVSYRSYDLSHHVEPFSSEVFTTIHQASVRNADYDRMMMFVRLNEERRERQLSHSKAELQAQIDDLKNSEVIDDVSIAPLSSEVSEGSSSNASDLSIDDKEPVKGRKKGLSNGRADLSEVLPAGGLGDPSAGGKASKDDTE
ncbi:MAG: hypothetical protein [Microviridae sp.]|nr:MAG: hypothetical protein [Microviridae sp.]